MPPKMYRVDIYNLPMPCSIVVCIRSIDHKITIIEPNTMNLYPSGIIGKSIEYMGLPKIDNPIAEGMEIMKQSLKEYIIFLTISSRSPNIFEVEIDGNSAIVSAEIIVIGTLINVLN